MKKNSNFAVPYQERLTHGVIGNTSDFGSEESRFEPWWVNKKSESVSESERLALFVLALTLTHTHCLSLPFALHLTSAMPVGAPKKVQYFRFNIFRDII